MRTDLGPPMPTSVDAVTAEWLTSALRSYGADVTVQRVDVVDVIWGTATKVRLKATYAQPPAPGGPPGELCVKGGFDERLQDLGTAIAYRLEAGFFSRLAPSLNIPLPGCWFAGLAENGRTGVLVLDDLTAQGARFGSPLEAWPVDRVAAALEVIAAWHGATWGDRHDRYPWLPKRSIIADMSKLLTGQPHWDAHFADAEAPHLPDSLDDRTRVAAALRQMWEVHTATARAISHGDAHLGNTYVDAAGRPAFLDWQAVCLGPPLDDVAYFVTGALDPPARRRAERDLLQHYLHALAATGAAAPTFDAAWREYRRFSLHGLLWALTPPVMQSWANVRAMADRHMAATVELESLTVPS